MWNARYTGEYRIVSFPGKTQVEMEDSMGKVKIVHISDVKYILPAEWVILKLPDYHTFGRQSRLNLDP